MKDPAIAYKERLENILNLINEEKYKNCYNVSKNLTNFGWTIELKDEVFISEILEGIYDQVGDLLSDYKIPPEKRDELKNELSSGMKKLISAYSEKDPTELYDCLRELRYSATFHQLHGWQKYPEKTHTKFRREIL